MKIYRPRKGSLNFKHRSVKGSKLIPSYLNASLMYCVKAGMSTIEINNIAKPITILEIPEHNVIGYVIYKLNKKFKNIYNYSELKEYLLNDSFKINYLVELNLPLIAATEYNYKIKKQMPVLKELNELQDIGPINLDVILDSFSNVDVTAISKGKGFTGVVKKYGLKLKKRKHARANKTRHIGSISPRGLGKMTRYSKQAGHMGCFRRTTYNLKLIKTFNFENKELKNYGIIKNKNIALVGSIPGPVKRIILLKKPRNVN